MSDHFRRLVHMRITEPEGYLSGQTLLLPPESEERLLTYQTSTSPMTPATCCENFSLTWQVLGWKLHAQSLSGGLLTSHVDRGNHAPR